MRGRAQLQPSPGVPGDGDDTEGTGLCRIPRSLCVPGTAQGNSTRKKSPAALGGPGLELGQHREGGICPPDPQDPTVATSPTGQGGDSCSGASGGYKKERHCRFIIEYFDFTASLMQLLGGGFFCFLIFSFLSINNFLFLLGFKLFFFFSLLSFFPWSSATCTLHRQPEPGSTSRTQLKPLFCCFLLTKKQETANTTKSLITSTLSMENKLFFFFFFNIERIKQLNYLVVVNNRHYHGSQP